MPMVQDDIRRHYESAWQETNDAASTAEQLRYSSSVEDAVLYPAYAKLIADLKLIDERSRVLDVGSGSGRWVRFFLERYAFKRFVGVDFAESAVKLLRKWYPSSERAALRFDQADITRPELDLGERFDLINIANVLFHIPEHDRYVHALRNLASHLTPGGRIVTTEYMPRTSMRTEWMLVRSRYDFQQLADQAGLTILHTRAFCFFSNDPMGLDGPDQGTRGHFNRVRAMTGQLIRSCENPSTTAFLHEMLAEIERACVSFATERVADVDLPSQKLVVLGLK